MDSMDFYNMNRFRRLCRPQTNLGRWSYGYEDSVSSKFDIVYRPGFGWPFRGSRTPAYNNLKHIFVYSPTIVKSYN